MNGSAIARMGLVMLLAGLGGCGYSVEPLHPTDVRTVIVPIWQRGEQVFRRDLEFRLTEALVKQIEKNTPYKVVAGTKVGAPRQADTELAGSIDRVEQRVLSYNPDTGRPREMEMTVYVSFVWKDLRTGNIRVRRDNFPVTGTYVPHEPFGQDFFQGSEGVMDELARRVVEQMERGWD